MHKLKPTKNSVNIYPTGRVNLVERRIIVAFKRSFVVDTCRCGPPVRELTTILLTESRIIRAPRPSRGTAAAGGRSGIQTETGGSGVARRHEVDHHAPPRGSASPTEGAGGRAG